MSNHQNNHVTQAREYARTVTNPTDAKYILILADHLEVARRKNRKLKMGNVRAGSRVKDLEQTIKNITASRDAHKRNLIEEKIKHTTELNDARIQGLVVRDTIKSAIAKALDEHGNDSEAITQAVTTALSRTNRDSRYEWGVRDSNLLDINIQWTYTLDLLEMEIAEAGGLTETQSIVKRPKGRRATKPGRIVKIQD